MQLTTGQASHLQNVGLKWAVFCKPPIAYLGTVEIFGGGDELDIKASFADYKSTSTRMVPYVS